MKIFDICKCLIISIIWGGGKIYITLYLENYNVIKLFYSEKMSNFVGVKIDICYEKFN